MRFNERQLINIGLEKPDFEGNLHYKRVQANGPNSKGFKEYWFRLKSNILFYYKLNSKRQLSSNQPYGLFVLEDSKVQYEGDSETPFAFSITFKDDYDKKHLFGARSETDVLQWINALKEASYGYLRNRLHSLEEQLKVKANEKKVHQKPSALFVHGTSGEARNDIYDSHASSVQENRFNLIQF